MVNLIRFSCFIFQEIVSSQEGKTLILGEAKGIYSVTIHLVYLPQRTFRQYRIFNCTSPSFCVMSYFNVIQITAKVLKNPDKFLSFTTTFNFLIWFNSFLMLVKFTLKDKMHNTIK